MAIILTSNLAICLQEATICTCEFPTMVSNHVQASAYNIGASTTRAQPLNYKDLLENQFMYFVYMLV
jgi:hypothetical protein